MKNSDFLGPYSQPFQLGPTLLWPLGGGSSELPVCTLHSPDPGQGMEDRQMERKQGTSSYLKAIPSLPGNHGQMD